MFQKYFFNTEIIAFNPCEKLTVACHPVPTAYTIVGDFIKLKLPYETIQFQYDFVELAGGLVTKKMLIIPMSKVSEFYTFLDDLFPEIRIFPQLYRQRACTLTGEPTLTQEIYPWIANISDGVITVHTAVLRDRRGPMTLHPDDTTPRSLQALQQEMGKLKR